MVKSKKQIELEQQIGELTADLQRTRADFENYRKRVEQDKTAACAFSKVDTILKLLPVVDNIERAISHLPKDLKDNTWAQAVVSLMKNLDSSLDALGLKRIDAKPGTEFNPVFHEAVQFDENVKGNKEIIAEVLQTGYTLNSETIRPTMVKVVRR
jgi:molecular chaperone GrpE